MLQSHTTPLIWACNLFNNEASRCARERGTDTQHPELLPAFPSVIDSAARSACVVSWDKVKSLAGFVFSRYHLGICVHDPSALPAVGAQSRETAGPAQGVSKLRDIQKTCRLQVCASRGGKTAVFKQFYLNKHCFCSLQIDNLSTQKLQCEWAWALPCYNF